MGFTRSEVLPSGGGGPPGTWTKLGQGPTTVPNGVDVAVLTFPFTAGEVALFMVTPGSGLPGLVETPFVPGTTAGYYQRNPGSGSVEFRINNNSGVPVIFDWVVYKVVP